MERMEIYLEYTKDNLNESLEIIFDNRRFAYAKLH